MYFVIHHGLKSILPAGAGAEDGVGEAEGPADGTELGLLLGEEPPPPETKNVLYVTKIDPFFQRFPFPAWIEIILPAGVGEIDGVGPELLGLLLPDGEGLDEGELVGELEDGEPPANNKGLIKFS